MRLENHMQSLVTCDWFVRQRAILCLDSILWGHNFKYIRARMTVGRQGVEPAMSDRDDSFESTYSNSEINPKP